MGNQTNQVEAKRRKKKGRPSLLDLQKRSLRLQQQQKNPNPSISPNPYLRFQASSSSSGRRPTRRNPNPDPDGDAAPDDDDDDEDDDSTGRRRREKKLRLVLRLPPRSANSASGSESEGRGAKKRKIDAVAADRDKTERQNSASKATDPSQEPSDSGPTTPLPDKKLLVFILDRLQKKDTYGVFSEPVDPNELPDYHDIIEHPMDFGTIRKKLSNGAYANLEQFEKDVFLISTNAMRYNAPDTIYYRQARSIQELAKKNFDNLREESDDNEPEQKPVRRGRPPSKKTVKQSVGRPSADGVGSDFCSGATLASAVDNGHFANLANDLLKRGSVLDKAGMASLPGGPYGLRNAEILSWISGHKTERNEEFSGCGMKGVSTKSGKKLSDIDENRRNTYNQPHLSTCVHQPPVLTVLDVERKQLVPVGLHMEYAYMRSLARFAANLGPIGWKIAAKRIQRALPPGTRFGPGWVGESEAPLQSQPLLSTSTRSASQPMISSSTTTVSTTESPSNKSAVVEGLQVVTSLPPQALASAVSSRSTNSIDGPESAAAVSYGSHSSGVIQPKTPLLLHQNPATQPTVNGFNTTMVFNMPSQDGKMLRPSRPPGSSSLEAMNTCAGAFGTVSRGNSSCINQTPLNKSNADKAVAGSPSSLSNSSNRLLDSGQGSQGPWRGLLSNVKPGSVPPDLNVGFQSPGSPVSGVLVDSSQQPDLALQL